MPAHTRHSSSSARDLRRQPRRLLHRTLGQQDIQDPLGLRIAASAATRAPFDQHHELAALAVLVGLDPGQRFSQRAAVDFLEQLGQLAREHDLAARLEHGHQRLDAIDDAVRRLVDHQGRRHRAPERGQFRFALLGLGRQEADEIEAVVHQAAGRQGRDRRRGARQRHHAQAGGAHRVDDARAGIGHGRRAGIRHQRHPLARRRRSISLSATSRSLCWCAAIICLFRPKRVSRAPVLRVSSQATTSASASRCSARR
jgi:hypothetical protein